jgi:UDP-2-acetamido-3-amino-2,3-dideoxy-glucuronate N-acetyltransferase
MQFYAHPTAVIDEGCSVGDGTKIWHFTHVMSGAVIGKNCVLGQNVFVDNKVILGNNVHIQNNVSVYEGVICEDDVFLGPSVVLTNVINPRSSLSRKDQFKTTLIKRGATIGANATIVCGNQIGEYAFIGAGAVITKDVLPYALMTGNPGKHSGWISEYGHRLTFDENQKAVCPESGQEYFLENDLVKKIR